MTTQTITEKQKIIEKIIKKGANIDNAKRWADEHYEYVSQHYNGVSKMAEVIMSL